MPTTQLVSVRTWEQCETRFRAFQQTHDAANPAGGRLVFRGQPNADWPLSTTLERHTDNGTCLVASYYRDINIIKPEIEAYTSHRWEITSNDDIKSWASDYDQFSIGDIYALEYLVYLRHHGFPSPLLDWSKSPYVAAYFAFANARKEDNAAIFVYSEPRVATHVGSSDAPVIHLRANYIRAHRRHFRQQSSYTTCAAFDPAVGWAFVSHQKFLDSAFARSGSLSKIVIPGALRNEVLAVLDRVNLNAFTLFEDDENLMKTLAFRELRLNPFVI